MDRFGRTHFSGDNSLFLPAHYLEQFHADFNDDAAALAAELGFEDWIKMFNDRRAQGYNQSAVTVGRPYMDFHVPEVVESNRVLLVRNPYYHHVDTANNQLPYVDRLEITHVGDKQLYDLKASAGEADFVAYYTGAPSLPTYKAGEAQGDAAGLSERDGDGFRLRPDDGKRLNLVIEIGVLEGPKQAICELISNDWRQVGIEGACKLVDGALQSERLDANETAITAWHLGRTTLLGRGTPDQFAFERCGANNWGRQWCFWFVSGGDSGMEPGRDQGAQRALAGVQAGRHRHPRRGAAGQGVLRLLRRRAADDPDHRAGPASGDHPQPPEERTGGQHLLGLGHQLLCPLQAGAMVYRRVIS